MGGENAYTPLSLRFVKVRKASTTTWLRLWKSTREEEEQYAENT